MFNNFLKPENWFSLISVSFSVSAIFMSIFLSRQKTKDSYGKHLKISLSLMVIIASLKALNMIGYFAGLLHINFVIIASILTMFAAGMASISFNVPLSTIIQTKVDAHQLGKVTSVMSVVSQALIPLSALVAGILISQISIIALYVFSITGMVIVAIWYIRNQASNEI